jgi:uracil-DNA glycosylase
MGKSGESNVDGDWAASALKWWEEAGVDTIVGETPRDWLAPAKGNSESAGAGFAVSAGPSTGLRPVPLPVPGRIELPDDLAGFQAWLAAGEVPLAAPSAGRVGPAGDPGSGLMVLIDMPSAADVAAGVLLAGEAGGLFDRMMQAIGRSRETLYLASLSPVRTATGTFDAAAAREFAGIARHHVGLVRPRALLLFGEACSRALLGAPIAQARGKWHELEIRAGKISTLVTIRPEKLLSQPGLKKLAWEDLQMLREGLKS